jgi:hypothetical protein
MAVAESTGYTTKRSDIVNRWGSLQNERSSWISHWTDLTKVLLPWSGRYFAQDRNRGGKRNNEIIDNAASRALKVMAAGLMAGATSPARPWFRLAASDPDLNKVQSVKIWLDDAAKRVMAVFQDSNTYRALHQIYEELGVFGTAASIVLDDFDTVIHHYPLTVGEYAIAANDRGQVDTLYREFDDTVRNVVKRFGFENCSTATQQLFKRGDPTGLDQWVTIIQAIEPRNERDVTKADAKNMAWRSCYIEKGGNEEKVLRESGYPHFPVLAPRWAVSGGDIYGNSPGMESLGDARALQHLQKRKGQVIDYQTMPPLQAPTALRNLDVEMLPGGVTFIDSSTPHGGIRSAFEASLDLGAALEDIRDVRDRINRSFFADLFLMLANSTDQSKTATEVAELHEEKMLMLGPVLERLQTELHKPLVEMTFDRLMAVGGLPQPPEELHGMTIGVEFVSMLAQAQKMIGTNASDRFVGGVRAVAEIKPEVLDKFDSDAWADSYSDMLGVDPRLVKDTEEVAKLRDARNRANAAKEQAAMMEQQANTANKLAGAPTGPGANNALTDVMNQYSNYTSPAPESYGRK